MLTLWTMFKYMNIEKSIRLPGLEPGTNRFLCNRLQSTALPIAPQPACSGILRLNAFSGYFFSQALSISNFSTVFEIGAAKKESLAFL